jgi:Tfp pilus assembly protein PilZ
MQKQVKLKKYNIRIAKLLDVILNMSEEQQEAILQYAEELVRGDRRFSDRKSCDLQVDFATTSLTHKGYIKNISTKGVFIKSQAPIIIGETVLMVFRVNHDSKAVKLKGEIAHATRWGIGVEFTAKGPRFEQQIIDLIQRIR